jgi:hypothetical protein
VLTIHKLVLPAIAMAAVQLAVAAVAADIAASAAAPTAASAVAPQPRAQRLLEQTLKRHPELMHLVMHVTPPGKSDAENVIIASSIGRIGKLADADDLRVMHSGVAEQVLAKSGDRYSVSLPMLDRGGKTIGVLAVAFRYQAGDDTRGLAQAAARIRDELQRKIRSVERLFEQ